MRGVPACLHMSQYTTRLEESSPFRQKATKTPRVLRHFPAHLN
jgi:hypothetical protein